MHLTARQPRLTPRLSPAARSDPDTDCTSVRMDLSSVRHQICHLTGAGFVRRSSLGCRAAANRLALLRLVTPPPPPPPHGVHKAESNTEALHIQLLPPPQPFNVVHCAGEHQYAGPFGLPA